MVAFHYPPCAGSSGLQRTLAFTRYLSDYGWKPALLTAWRAAYEKTDDGQLAAVPSDMPIGRAIAFDAARHLAIAGRHHHGFAVPDRWRSWRLFGVASGLRLVRKFRPSVIWSTYPIATAHALAAELSRRTRLPWIADMRDPMVETDPVTGIDYPQDPAIRLARLRIERQVIERAAHVVFCTREASRICAERYGEAHAAKFSVIPNGFDEDVFREVEVEVEGAVQVPARGRSAFRLVHSGTVYPGDRGPDSLFTALAALRQQGALPAGFRLALRASGYEAAMRELIRRFAVADLVELAPAIPYREAVREMLTSDGLLLLQGHASNPAIPAKIYEYLRARRPILALVHAEGETVKLLRELRTGIVAAIDDTEQIQAALLELFRQSREHASSLPDESVIGGYSRARQTAFLAEILEHSIEADRTGIHSQSR